VHEDQQEHEEKVLRANPESRFRRTKKSVNHEGHEGHEGKPKVNSENRFTSRGKRTTEKRIEFLRVLCVLRGSNAVLG
jgi:hypothetical protein